MQPDAAPDDRVHFPVNAEGCLEADVPCAACQYNLRGARQDGTCPECGHDVAASITEAAGAGPQRVLTLRTFGLRDRMIAVLLGVVLPMLCFGIAESGPLPLLIEWQSGRWHEMVGLLLGGVPARPFYPLLLLAMGSLGALVIRPLAAAHSPLVRLGIYSGVVLSAMFCLIQFTAIGGPAGPVVTLLGVACLAGAAALLVVGPMWLLRILHWPHWWKVQLGFAFASLLFALILLGPGFLVLGLLFAPALTLTVFVLLSVRLLRSGPALDGDLRTVGPWWWLAWLGVYLAGLGTAIALAIEAYAKLPTQAPHCYIATAAARGHRRLVGSAPVMLPGRPPLLVNRQLRSLKCLELALVTVAPTVHRQLRRVYDMLGPRLARDMSPLAADAAWLLLWPMHRLGDIVLRRLVPRYESLRDRLFAPPVDRS